MENVSKSYDVNVIRTGAKRILHERKETSTYTAVETLKKT
jgi:hypothetical protein